MEISGNNLSTNTSPSDWSATDSNGKATVKPAVAEDSRPPAVGQDKVTLSPAALNAQMQERNTGAANTEATAPKAGTSPPTDTVNDKETPPSAQSFVYGVLGLERPEKTEDKPTDGYTMGRWLAATITAGAIISILV